MKGVIYQHPQNTGWSGHLFSRWIGKETLQVILVHKWTTLEQARQGLGDLQYIVQMMPIETKRHNQDEIHNGEQDWLFWIDGMWRQEIA